MIKGYVILDVGKAFDYPTFEKLFDESLYKLLYIGESYFVDDLKKNVKSQNVEYWPYKKLYNYDVAELESIRKHDLTEVIDYVVNNKLTTEIYDRTMSKYLFNYSTKNDMWIIKATIAAYKFILTYNPVFMLLYECSHNIRSWVVAQVCEFCGIPVRYCRNHVFMWRNVLLEGMQRYPKLLGDDAINDHYSDWEFNMYKEIASRYEKGTEAIKPEYLEKMKEMKTNKIYSFWKDFKQDWKRPERVWYKHKCYKVYERVCSSAIPEKYIVFYLHLQPERTTLPEGYGFTQQYKAISLLNELIPEDWRVVVKEHPATFYRYCSPNGRWPQYYRDLAALKKIVLVPLETDTYQLMANSQAVATIAGTVGREAMMMGKACINFGISPYFNKKPLGMYTYESYNSLKDFVYSMHELKPNAIKQSFADYVKTEMIETGVNGLIHGQQWKNKDDVVIESNMRSRFKLINYILSK